MLDGEMSDEELLKILNEEDEEVLLKKPEKQNSLFYRDKE